MARMADCITVAKVCVKRINSSPKGILPV